MSQRDKKISKPNFAKSKIVEYFMSINRAYDVLSTQINHAVSQGIKFDFNYQVLVGLANNTSPNVNSQSLTLSTLNLDLSSFNIFLDSSLAGYDNMKKNLENLSAYLVFYEGLYDIVYDPDKITIIRRNIKSALDNLNDLNSSISLVYTDSHTIEGLLARIASQIAQTGKPIPLGPNSTFQSLVTDYTTFKKNLKLEDHLKTLNSALLLIHKHLLEADLLFDVQQVNEDNR